MYRNFWRICDRTAISPTPASKSHNMHDFLMKHNFVFEISLSRWQHNLHEAAHLCLLQIGILFFHINVDMYSECHSSIDSGLVVSCTSHAIKCVAMEAAMSHMRIAAVHGSPNLHPCDGGLCCPCEVCTRYPFYASIALFPSNICIIWEELHAVIRQQRYCKKDTHSIFLYKPMLN